MIKKIINIRNKWRTKYNSLCIKYVALADKRIAELEEDREILLQNIRYREDLDKYKDAVSKYKKKFGKLEGGGKNDKSKNK